MNECVAYTFYDSAGHCRLNLLSSLQTEIAFKQILDWRPPDACDIIDRSAAGADRTQKTKIK